MPQPKEQKPQKMCARCRHNKYVKKHAYLIYNVIDATVATL